MDTQWVEVLHGSYGEATVICIADALELNLLPALQTLFHEDLRSEGESAFCQFNECLLVGTDTRTQSSEGVSRTNHDGEADLMGSLQGIFHVLHRMTHWHLQVNLT